MIDDILDGGIAERKLGERSVLLARRGGTVSWLESACAHLGMPLDMSEIADGVITLPVSRLPLPARDLECLTAREMQLKVLAMRGLGQRVQMRLGG